MNAYKVVNVRSQEYVGRIVTDDQDVPQEFYPSSPIQKHSMDGYMGVSAVPALRESMRWYDFQPVADVENRAGEIVKMDPDQQLVFGWAYVMTDTDGTQVVDKSGDFVDDVEEIEKAAYDFVLTSRSSDADHTNVKGGEMVESIVFTPEKLEAMGIAKGAVPLGWWVGFKVQDSGTWDRVKNKELVMFSVHGTGTRTPVEE